ncbi:MAG: hypothetical protein EOO77_41295 [Oxalobacteraceae bacterium]|nr:MAG: hypothetical protein EOO77_41295 [Oxalobacteraceae bacterium]
MQRVAGRAPFAGLPGSQANVFRPSKERRNSGAIAEALIRIADDPQEAAHRTRLGLQAVRPFAWDTVAEQAIVVFRGLRRE